MKWMFDPETIALIGASEKEGPLGIPFAPS